MSGTWTREDVVAALKRKTAHQVDADAADRHAAVALIVRPRPEDLEVLFVKRAEVDGDPWSGHMALPGGHRDQGDADLLETARRETREEVGLDLPADAFLGRLDDLHPFSRRIPSIRISPYVAWHDRNIRVATNHEVQYHLWAPLRALADPALASEVRFTGEERERVLPSIEFEGDTIWGLTHRIIVNFQEVLRGKS